MRWAEHFLNDFCAKARRMVLSFSAAAVEFQIQHINAAIAQSAGNMSQAATRLGLHRSNLYRKMRQLGMEVPK